MQQTHESACRFEVARAAGWCEVHLRGEHAEGGGECECGARAAVSVSPDQIFCANDVSSNPTLSWTDPHSAHRAGPNFETVRDTRMHSPYVMNTASELTHDSKKFSELPPATPKDSLKCLKKMGNV